MAMFMNNRPMQKVLLKNTTRMSLHERFTYLRGNSGDGTNPAQRQRELQQQAARNRRLALQMERRPAVMAALKLKKRSLRQRLGLTGPIGSGPGGALASRSGYSSVKDRLSLGRKSRKLRRGGGRGGQLSQQQQSPPQRRGRPRGGGLGGPNARGRLSRSQSMQSLNNAGRFGNRSRSRSRSRSRVRANSISNSNLNKNNNQLRFRNKLQGRGGLGRGASRGGSPRFIQRGRQGRGRGSMFRGRRIGNNRGLGRGRRGNDRGGIRGRNLGSRGRGLGRGGRGGRRGGNNTVPTREELDNQLDQYMANSRYSLDKDLDTYMKEANTMGTSGGGGSQEESWD